MDFLGGKAIRPIEARIKRGLQHLLVGQCGDERDDPAAPRPCGSGCSGRSYFVHHPEEEITVISSMLKRVT